MTNPGLKTMVKNLKVSTVPGHSNDGAKVRVHYKAFRPSDEGGRLAAKTAVEMGMDKDTYTGVLDKVWVTKGGKGDLCMTVLALERIDPNTGKYTFRTFNLEKGTVVSIQLLG